MPNFSFASFVSLAMSVMVVTVTGCTFEPAKMGTRGRWPTNSLVPSVPKAGFEKAKLIRSEFAAGEVDALCAQSQKQLELSLESEVRSAVDLDRILADYYDNMSALFFMGYVHQDGAIRDEGSHCEEIYSQAMVDVFTRRDLYEVVKSTPTQTEAEARLVSEFARQFEQNGMALGDEELAKFREWKSELASLEVQFSKNLNEDTTAVEYAEDELSGLSTEFKESLTRSKKGQYVVTTKSTDYLEVMQNAIDPHTRYKMQKAYDSRAAKKNIELLDKAIVLRQKIAQLMGYKVWADYRIKGRMAGDSTQVMGFLLDLQQRLRPRLEADLDLLLKAKQQIENPSSLELKAWDIRYFENQVKKRDYSLDNEVIREYFPKDTVVRGMFEVYSTILGVTYEEIVGAQVWAPEVKLYAVHEKSTGETIAYFYTDFVPREGKYGHAAAFDLIKGRLFSEGQYSQPVSAIVANFSPPKNGKPSLLSHHEVETLFHEFGHIMHQTLTRAPYAYLAGSNTEQDFVEAPSQMLEGWVWNAEILSSLSGHYQDSSRKLPAELIEKMLAAQDFNLGYYYSRQLMLGLTDMRLHTADNPVSVDRVYRQTHQSVLNIAPVRGSHFMAGFGHMMGGYDAGYYGYLWSEVYAADMFATFEKKGLLNSEMGGHYRKTILEKGNMVDPLSLVTEFLGRAPTNEAFLKRLGL